ncbi:MAG: hypothetical protein ACLUEK_07950 [Oscillospiraceae bacterium]
MKRHLSVFELAARGAVYKTLVVSLIAAAAIFALLYALPGGALNLTDLLSGSYFSAEAENYVVTGGRYASYVFPAAGRALRPALPLRRAQTGVNPDYTWRRLRITERRASLIQSGVHALCFALYMAIVLAACAAFAALFLPRSGPYDNDGQTLFSRPTPRCRCTPCCRSESPSSGWPLPRPAWAAASAPRPGLLAQAGKTSGLGVTLLITTALMQLGWSASSGFRTMLVLLTALLAVIGLVSSFRDTAVAEREAEQAKGMEGSKGGKADASA